MGAWLFGAVRSLPGAVVDFLYDRIDWGRSMAIVAGSGCLVLLFYFLFFILIVYNPDDGYLKDIFNLFEMVDSPKVRDRAPDPSDILSGGGGGLPEKPPYYKPTPFV